MQVSFYAPLEKLRQLQELVRAHNLRFVGNPITLPTRAYVTLSSEHLPPGTDRTFFEDWQRVLTPVREVRASAWRRFNRRVLGRLKALA